MEVFREAAEAVRPYDGVVELPARLRHTAAEVHAGTEVEMVILSSGYVEVIQPTRSAKRLDRLFGSGFHLKGSDAVCVKRIIWHPEKALSLKAIGKDTDTSGLSAPATRCGPAPRYQGFGKGRVVRRACRGSA